MTSDALQQATFRLVTREGKFAGTGFLADSEGTLLTCHHVAAGTVGLQAVDAKGKSWPANWSTPDDDVLARCDIALMQVGAPRSGLPPPVPLSPARPGPSFETRVQLKEGQTFVESVPFSGLLEAETKVVYRHDRTRYELVGRLVTGLHILPGMSGSAVWDPSADAVVAILAVGATEKGDIGGFASPLQHASASGALNELIKRNENTVPRRGTRPNRLGAADILAAATSQTLDRLRDRGIVDLARIVEREGFAEALDAYLASSSTAFPIVSAAGQGKTALLAKLAAHPPPSRPIWLVRAADFPIGEGPEAALERMLAASMAPAGCQWKTLPGYGAPAPLLLIDGVNELPLDIYTIADEWLPDLIAAVKRTGWRLVFTTRRELFGRVEEKRVVTRDLFQPVADSEKRASGWFLLGQFSEAEAEAAANAYAVPPEVQKRISRQPLIYKLVGAKPGTTFSRTGLLRAYVDELVGHALRHLPNWHRAEVDDKLCQIAVAAAGSSAVLRYDHPSLGDKALATALCHANLLERVESGFRIIFDEVSDFLAARHLTQVSTDTWPDEPANVLTLALELLANTDSNAASDMATRIALGDSGGDYRSRRRSFRIVAALERRPEFDVAKETAVDALIESKHLDRILVTETDLPSTLPPPALRKILTAAILAEEGYGWREKDVYSEHHRHSTASAARLRYGVTRLVDDLLSDSSLDGAGLLIDLLSDESRLSYKGSPGESTEATVGSFALCMLFAHQDRIGQARLFREVIVPERRGSRSLLEAFAHDQPEIAATLLEQIAEDTQASPSGLRYAWTILLRETKESGAIKERAARQLRALTDRLELRDFQELVLTGADFRLFDRAEIATLFDRVKDWPDLSHYTVLAVLKAGAIDLPQALTVVGRTRSLHRKFVSDLAASWRSPDIPAELRQVVQQVAECFPAAEELDFEGGWAVQQLAYQPTLEQAQAAGLCDYIGAMVDAGVTRNLERLTYPAFAQTNDARNTFREWIAYRLANCANVGEIAADAFEQAVGMNDRGDALPAIALAFAPHVSVRDIRWLVFRSPSEGRTRAMLAAMMEVARAANAAGEVQDLEALQQIFDDPSLSDSERRNAAFDYLVVKR